MNPLQTAIFNTAAALEADKLTASNHYTGMKESVRESLEYLLPAMFPEHIGIYKSEGDNTDARILHLETASQRLLLALSFVMDSRKEAEEKTVALINALPNVAALLKTDILAAYQGDPAARNMDEVLLAYPAFLAISVYRIAHELFTMNVPIIPRMMTEYAHERTGIDIHPGATIGSHFFIDHGTGVVIGETTTIGHHVKLYQNVTLGAKSFAVGDDGSLVKGIKRHPNIGNNVVIYAGATILGGNTFIGDNCVIGGNVWLTHSVEAGETVVTRVSRQVEKNV